MQWACDAAMIGPVEYLGRRRKEEGGRRKERKERKDL
jgi:hypothetical protein